MDYELTRQYLKTCITIVFILLLLVRVATNEISPMEWVMLILGSIIILGIGGILFAMLTMSIR